MAPIDSNNELKSRQRILKERSSLLRKKLLAIIRGLCNLKNIANVIFILGICTICIQQCYLQISEYLEFKTRIQVTHHFPTSAIWLAPGVTVCNSNRLRLDRLIEEEPTLEKRVNQILNNTSIAELTERRLTEIMRSIKQAVDDSINITGIINESSVSRLMRLSRYPMIKDINCNTAWGKQINCENIRIIESFQASPCNTAFYMGSLLESLASGRAYDFNTSLLGGGRKILPFDSHEIADILIDFDPLQHADFHRDIGGKIVIHSTGHIGSLRDVAHSIVPGNKYEIIIQRFMSKRLPPPYDSMCYDYKQSNSHLFTDREGSKGSVELDKTTCTRNCIIRKTTKACNCWPVEVPFYPGDNLVENSDSYRMCAWGYEEANIRANYSTKLYIDCYRKFHAECREACRHGCRTEDYKVHVMSNPWPSRDKFFLSRSESERQELYRLRGCCAMISIKYLEFTEKRNIMYPNLTLAQLVSNIGGIVSALVGVSSVTIYRYITRHVLHLKIVRDSYPPDLEVGDDGTTDTPSGLTRRRGRRRVVVSDRRARVKSVDEISI